MGLNRIACSNKFDRLLFPAKIFESGGQPGDGNEVVWGQLGGLASQLDGMFSLTNQSIKVTECLVSEWLIRIHLDGSLCQFDSGLN